MMKTGSIKDFNKSYIHGTIYLCVFFNYKKKREPRASPSLGIPVKDSRVP